MSTLASVDMAAYALVSAAAVLELEGGRIARVWWCWDRSPRSRGASARLQYRRSEYRPAKPFLTVYLCPFYVLTPACCQENP